jgi:hypothetical protein
MQAVPLGTAGFEDFLFVGKVPVHGEPLHAGTLGERADRRRRRPNVFVKRHGGIDDSLARLALPGRALLEPLPTLTHLTDPKCLLKY